MTTHKGHRNAGITWRWVHVARQDGFPHTALAEVTFLCVGDCPSRSSCHCPMSHFPPTPGTV